jgi:pimeloyl-ACP methyl ester carboxylesterase
MTLLSCAAVSTTPDDQPQPFSLETRVGSVELATFGNGPAVLCLHGAMGGYDQALILAKTLGGTGYRFVAPSRPGYLGTPLSRGRAPEQQADLYAAVLDALHIERTAVMAVSGGGPSAIHFALRHQQRCWGLVLVSTPAGRVNNRLPLSFKIIKLLARIPCVASLLARKTAKRPEQVARRSITNPSLLERTMGSAEAWELLKELQNSTVERMALRFAGTENDVEVTRTHTYPLAEIAVPTLIVQGTADPWVPFESNAKVFASEVRAAELVALQDGEHAAIFSHRDEARRRVGSFLRRHSPASSAIQTAETTSA